MRFSGVSQAAEEIYLVNSTGAGPARLYSGDASAKIADDVSAKNFRSLGRELISLALFRYVLCNR